MSGTACLDGLAGVVLGASPFDYVARLQQQVREKGACSLPGVSIDYNKFMVIMWRAVSLGWVSHSNAEFVAHGLWHGFDCGLDVNLLRGRRRFRNYKSALEARAKVTKATRVRVSKSKTLMLCSVPDDYNVQSLTPVIPFLIIGFSLLLLFRRQWSRRRCGR